MKLFIRAGLFFVTFFLIAEGYGQVLENYNPHLNLIRKNEYSITPVMASVRINVSDYPQSSFEMDFPNDAAVFVGDKLWFYTKADTSFIVPTKVLRELAEVNESEVDLVVYKGGIDGEDVSIKKGLFRTNKEIKEGSNNRDSQIRKKDSVKDFLIVAFIIILALISLFKVTYPVMFQSVLRPSSVFSEDLSDPGSGGSVYSSDMVFNLLVFSMLLSLLIMSAIYFTEVSLLEKYLLGNMNFLFLVWLTGTGIFMVFSYLKYFWVKMFTSVYHIDKWGFGQFYYLMRGLSILMLLAFSSIIGFYLQGYEAMDKVLEYTVSAFLLAYLFGVFRLFYIMLKKVPFKSYHLFSYICSSELIPFLVVAKIILG